MDDKEKMKIQLEFYNDFGMTIDEAEKRLKKFKEKNEKKWQESIKQARNKQ